MKSKTAKRYLGGFSLNVILIGAISFLTDASSEMIVPILPLYLIGIGAPMVVIGLIEGAAESTASILKALSGTWSDKMKKRRPFMLAGYSLSTVSKFLFVATTAWWQVVGLKISERAGKGIRAAPKDALLAESCDPDVRGRVYGFHKAMDTAGAAFGVVLALVVVGFLALGYREIFLLSAIPATVAVILIFFIRESEPVECEPLPREKKRIFEGFSRFPPELKLFMVAMSILSVTSVMTSFLIILARDAHASQLQNILMYLGFNVVYFAISLPAGSISDKVGRYPVILIGYAAMMCMFVVAIAGSFVNEGLDTDETTLLALSLALASFLIYGLSYAFTQGVQKAFVADLCPKDLKGTAMGVYNMSIGIAALPMALIGGTLWTVYGSWATFAFGAVACAVGLSMLAALAVRRGFFRTA
ncbi:MAG: MFS transporter [Methanobacteriota archaeon]